MLLGRGTSGIACLAYDPGQVDDNKWMDKYCNPELQVNTTYVIQTNNCGAKKDLLPLQKNHQDLLDIIFFLCLISAFFLNHC